MNEACLILTTGGTIDKVYFDAKSSYAVGESEVGELLMHGHVALPYTIRSIMRKDSLDLDDSDRLAIRQAIEEAEESRILVTHGTDTMVETARVLAATLPDKTIVLTGAMIPIAFGSSDGLFNLGSALAFAQSLPSGVYVAMNGRCFSWDNVRKNRDAGVFEELNARNSE